MDSTDQSTDSEESEFMKFKPLDIDQYVTEELLPMSGISTICDDLKHLISSRTNTDIVIKQAKSIEHCHGDVLRYHSEYLNHYMPTGSVLNLSCENVHPIIFKFLYEWMILGSIECPRNRLIELLEAGFFYTCPCL